MSRRTYLLFTSIILSFLMLFLVVRTGRAASSITVTSPTPGTAIPESLDFAIEEFSDPWDFSQATDVRQEDKSGIGNFQVTGGSVIGSTTNNDPNFFVYFPSYADSTPMGRDGLLHPLNTSQYRYLTFRMYASSATWTQFFWFYNQFWTSFGSTSVFISPGWNTYKVDLGANAQWAGQPTGFRVDPANGPGVDFVIDWIKLHRAPTTQNQLVISWNDISPGGNASIYLDGDGDVNNGNLGLLATRPSNASNSWTWDSGSNLNPADFPAGTYYVWLQKGVDKSLPVAFDIRSPALVNVLDPDEVGGQDYATAVTGDAWDMNEMSDISASYGIFNFGVGGGVLSGMNANGDPNMYFRVGAPIDTSRYHRLTFSMAYDPPFDFGYGTMARYIWNPFGFNESSYQTTYPLIIYPEWTQYTLDLKTAKIVSGNLGWSNTVTTFRFDPLETPGSRRFWLDWVTLSADDEASVSFPIKWQDDRPSAPETTVSIYYDNDDAGFDGTLIASGITQNAGVNTYTWNVSQMEPGTYYVYIVATDGVSTGRQYSTGPLRVTTPNVPRWYVKKAVDGGFDTQTTWSAPWGGSGDYPLSGNFDGDAYSDIAIYRQSNAGWYIRKSTGTNFGLDTSWSAVWGNPGTETPFIGDFDGDDKDDIAIYRYGSYPNWFFRLSTGDGFAAQTYSMSWGNPGGDTPKVGDFNGDGKDDLALYRYGAYPNWFVLINGTAQVGGPVTWGATWPLTWGNPGGDSPLVGDFNGDNFDDVGVYRYGSYPNWFFLASTGSGFNNPNQTWALSWGNPGGDVPIVGNFNGDLNAAHPIDDIGIFRVSSYPNWFVNYSLGSGFDGASDGVMSWGNPNSDSPLIGDATGDGKDDLVIFRQP